MGEQTGITWADKTWSPWRGCTKVSEGCKNCYAEGMSGRNPKVLGEWGPNGTRIVNANWETPRQWSREAGKAGRREFVFPSLCDPFEDFNGPMHDHKGNHSINPADTLPYTMPEIRDRFFDLTCQTPFIDWLVLTKRPENIMSMWPVEFDRPGSQELRKQYENVWLGTSVEDQASADYRLPHLLACRELSPVLWLSVEPLLGPIKFKTLDGIDWVIIGNESNGKKNGRYGIDPQATADDWCHWTMSIIEHCRKAGVAVFVKQIPQGGFVEKDPAKFPSWFRIQEFPTPRIPVPKT